MNIKTFAAKHNLKTKTDACGDTIIPGKHGQLYDHEDHEDHEDGERFAVIHSTTPRKWGFTRTECLAAGMELHQDGDNEGTLLFDPNNLQHVKVAIRAASCRVKKQLSPETLAKLAKRMATINASRPAARLCPQ